MFAIIDGSYYLHRALHQPAYRKMRTSAGVLSGGVFGFLRTVGTSLSAVHASRAICVWDGHRSERRLSLYPEYKSKSHKPLEDGFDYLAEYRASRDAVIAALPSLGIRSLCLPQREGDDTIYRVKRSFRNWRHDEKLVVLSEDRDMWQLVDEFCSIYRPHAGEFITFDNLDNRTGIAGPDEYLMWRALAGDSSDHIDGVRGIGDTRAVSLVRASRQHRIVYGLNMVESIQKTVAESKSKWAKAVLGSWDTVQRNLELMDLRKEYITKREKQIIRNVIRTPCSMAAPSVVFSLFDKFELRQLRGDFSKWSYPFRQLT